jgi:glycosyltransferase involved in cell wall biosynthesis
MADLIKAPLVSVVLPTYNRALLLPRAIRSVLNQSYRNLELIVVDDGSTDETERLVHSIEDDRIRYVSRDNGGPAAARNAGIEVAAGELIAFQDSDDEWLDGKLERQVEALFDSRDSAILCVCSYLKSVEDEPPSVRRIGAHQLVQAGDLRHQTLEMFYFTTPTWLVRRAALLRSGLFDTRLPCWEDWELAIRLSDLGEFVLVDETLHLQHFRRSGVNSDEVARMKSMARMLETHGPRWLAHRHTLAEHHYTVGRLACVHGSLADARHHLWRAVSANKHHRKAWVTLAITMLGTRRLRQAMEWRLRTPERRPPPVRPVGPRR